MGSESVSLKVVATVSKHNSARDDLDMALWLELTGRIRQLIEDDERFARISAWVM